MLLVSLDHSCWLADLFLCLCSAAVAGAASCLSVSRWWWLGIIGSPCCSLVGVAAAGWHCATVERQCFGMARSQIL
jgi:hypothetical protein